VKRQEYDVFQNRRYREFGNGVHTEYNFYPGTLRLKQQVTTTPARKIQDLNYGYDNVGNVKTVANNADGPFSNLLGGPSTQDLHLRWVLPTSVGQRQRAPGTQQAAHLHLCRQLRQRWQHRE